MNQIRTWVANQCNLIWTGSDFISMVLNRKKREKNVLNSIYFFIFRGFNQFYFKFSSFLPVSFKTFKCLLISRNHYLFFL